MSLLGDDDIKFINNIADEAEKEKTMKIQTDAPMSGNVRLYYKGYSIQITCRDADVEIKPLLEKMTQIVNFANSHNFTPSWNPDTNNAFSNKETTNKESTG